MARTIGGILADTEAQLAEAGCASPRVDAELLMSHVSGRSRTDLLLSRREVLADDDPLVTRLPSLVLKRVLRQPLQHIIGTAPMGRLELEVGPGVFVPRPETELLAEWGVGVLRRMREGGGVAKPTVVDLCTGSGALALAVADAVPAAEVVGVELDDTALGWASRNLERVRAMWARERGPGQGLGRGPAAPGARVRLIHGDATDPNLLPHLHGLVDLVVTNPPYVPEGADVGLEVRCDPHHAVFGGADGLDVIAPMIDVVRALLRPGGAVGIEHDDDSAADVAAVLRDAGCFRDIAHHRDLAGRDRFTTATRT